VSPDQLDEAGIIAKKKAGQTDAFPGKREAHSVFYQN